MTRVQVKDAPVSDNASALIMALSIPFLETEKRTLSTLLAWTSNLTIGSDGPASQAPTGGKSNEPPNSPSWSGLFEARPLAEGNLELVPRSCCGAESGCGDDLLFGNGRPDAGRDW